MGENEQGGMLRTVVVIGLVALIAAVITMGVVSLKNNMTKNTNRAVGAVATAKVPYSVKNPDVTYKKYTPDNSANWGFGHADNHFPLIGNIPNNSWREDRLVVNSSARIHISFDINTYHETWAGSNDNDDTSKRLLEVYDENGNKLASNNPDHKVYLDKDKDYTLIVKYFNNSGRTLIEREGDNNTTLWTGTDDGSPYRLKIKSFEAATYDDEYNK